MAPSPAGRSARRMALAVVRLLFLYAILVYVLLEIGLVSRSLIEAAPFLPHASPILSPAAFPARMAGVNVTLQQYADAGQRRAALQNLRTAGFGWVRQRADWRLLEPAPGRYAWAQMDAILADVAAAGLEMVIVLDGSPAWARAAEDRSPTGNPWAPPADNADLARFAAAFAHRYRSLVRFYQIWDEPNIAPHWGNRWIEPVAYGRMLAAVVPRIRAADADAVILLAALAPTADRGHTAIDEVYYLQRLYASGAASYFDAAAAQPFGFGLAPDDRRSRVGVLDFYRVGLFRRTMVRAGDAAKPIWAVRYGWNRSTNTVWQTVTPEVQMHYVEQANAIARSWPWLAGLGWAADRPDVPADDPLWGFALQTPAGAPTPLWDTLARVNRSSALKKRTRILTDKHRFSRIKARGLFSSPMAHGSAWGTALKKRTRILTDKHRFSRIKARGLFSSPMAHGSAWGTAPKKGPPAADHRPSPCQRASALVPRSAVFRPLSRLLFWLSALLLVVWRGWRAGAVARVDRWPARFASLPSAVKVAAWILLAIIYYFAQWPPLIGLCWLIAALFLAAEPLLGLVLAGLLLPFHYQHKELALVGAVLIAPPAYAAALCSLPGTIQAWGVSLRSLPARPLSKLKTFASTLVSFPFADRLALGWLAASLLSAAFAWQGTATVGGLWTLVIGPLLLYGLARSLVTRPTQQSLVAAGLAGGGVLAALVALFSWWNGDGTTADGVRRLVGVTFSPNQTALMLVRALFVCAGLVLARRGVRRWLWSAGAGIIALALVLTGSRGALLLGLPAGGMLLLALQPGIRRRLRRRPWLITVALIVVLIGASLTLGGRLFNSASVVQRLHIWQGAFDLWRFRPWLGTGPGGFFWRYPAFMLPAAANEPNLLHPHNVWLEYATGWGMLGLLWVAGLCTWLARRSLGKSRPLRGIEVGLLAALIAGLAHGQVDTFGMLPELAAWNWLAIGLLSNRTGLEKRPPTADHRPPPRNRPSTLP